MTDRRAGTHRDAATASRSTSTARWSTSTRRRDRAVVEAVPSAVATRARTSCCRPAGRCSASCACSTMLGLESGSLRGEQRRRDVHLPPGRDHDGDHVRPGARGAGRARRVPDALVAVEVIGRGYRTNRHFPEGEITRRDVAGVGRRAGARAGHPRDHPRPAVVGGGLRRAGRASSACTAPTTSSATPPGSTWRPRGCRRRRRWPTDRGRARGGAQADVLAIGDGRNDLEMLRVGRARGGDGPGARRGQGGRRRSHRRAGRRRRRRGRRSAGFDPSSPTPESDGETRNVATDRAPLTSDLRQTRPEQTAHDGRSSDGVTGTMVRRTVIGCAVPSLTARGARRCPLGTPMTGVIE